MAEKRPALGKGLSALIPSVPEPNATATTTEVDIDLLTPNAEQPRRDMDETALEELARSIRAYGVIQPIVVRPAAGGRFQIVAGERRWRASQRAGLHKVPVVVREIPPGDDRTLLQVALIENIQREDLNPIEQATAYRRLVDEFQLTQEDVAGAVGKDRSSVANTLRLLRLPEEVRTQVATGRLSMGHARALLAIEDGTALRRLAAETVARDYSVRQVEAIVKKQIEAPREPDEKRADVHTRAAEEQMRLSIGSKVKIVRKGKGGTVRIDFKSEDDLQRIYERITGN
ncbi:MAG: ParB/RepB/Spo0J family partition protein [Bacteroidales bacterium]